ncbi:hypothetical protein FLA105534_00364 [Flavobacterium bizetiae]|uniref:Uncharacterized protein n=1 Tax=Flavobacterium bizetiae TaxID=2704140 RepID=A0A6J4G7E2_9FLAO|nr:hypothetical protein [Flavobacterium bizetiae]CAA9194878.1 hypothetical protein FLA105534_00364 [Flavobacterium bizetiae]CAD5342520.1 hypothetical protein FLA105535_02508 [Flavobacterium bizetiae]CAD5348436.1 hypothetical protein FLA105534_02400 [Flavobacterium bizetiae]
MNVSDKEALEDALKNIDKKIDRFNDQKIKAFFESLGLDQRHDIASDYLNWENILIVVPSRSILDQVKKYKYVIARIYFIVNPNAEQIHIYDFKDWKNSTRNKTQFQIRELLRTNFGGVPKNAEDPDWIKLI